MPSDGDASVVKLMDNNDANSVSPTQNDAGKQLHIIKVYPLDGKSVAQSQFWVAVTQVQNELGKRLFLRDGQQHRSISTDSAMRLLSSENRMDLSVILKASSKKGGSTPAVVLNSIESIREQSSPRSVNPPIGTCSAYITRRSPGLDNVANVLSTASTDLVAIATLVQTAQLRSWGSIKVTGSAFFKKQVWLEAVSRGLYVEGYMHTEDDRRALFMRIPKSAQMYIRPEYRPTETIKKVPNTDFKSKSKIIKKNITDGNNQYELDATDLSEQELIYLLMRVHQIELGKTGMTSMHLTLQAISNIDTIAIDKEGVLLSIEPLNDETEFNTSV